MTGGPITTGEDGRMAMVVEAWGATSRSGPGKANHDRVGLDGTLFTVVDGLGGLPDPAAAATATVATVHASLPRDGDQLRRALSAANTVVRQLGQPDDDRPGASAVAVLIGPSSVHVASVGDCRAHVQIDDAPLRVVTSDDTVAGDRGLGPEDARYRELSHAVTRYLGRDALVDPAVVELGAGTQRMRILLTSDGVHDTVPVQEIARLFSHPRPDTVAEELVSRAVELGSIDDVTAVVVDLAPWRHR